MKNVFNKYLMMRKAALSGILWCSVAALVSAPQMDAQATCPIDVPCIPSIYVTNSGALVANVSGDGWDVINVRWSRPGREGEQREHPGRNGQIEVLSSTTRGVVYTVSVQGCNKRPLRSSRCTDWNQASVKAGARSANY